MSLSDYFNEVAAENANLATSYPGDLRLAINAIMTLDGFFGNLHAELHARSAPAEELAHRPFDHMQGINAV
jgi:hypothetical protein